MASKQQIAAEAYQVIGCIAEHAGIFDHPGVVRALDYFSVEASGEQPEGRELLPWGDGLRIGIPPARWEKVVLDEDLAWVEFITELEFPESRKVVIHLWRSLDGFYKVSAAFLHNRCVATLMVKDLEAAKVEALRWANRTASILLGE